MGFFSSRIVHSNENSIYVHVLKAVQLNLQNRIDKFSLNISLHNFYFYKTKKVLFSFSFGVIHVNQSTVASIEFPTDFNNFLCRFLP